MSNSFLVAFTPVDLQAMCPGFDNVGSDGRMRGRELHGWNMAGLDKNNKVPGVQNKFSTMYSIKLYPTSGIFADFRGSETLGGLDHKRDLSGNMGTGLGLLHKGCNWEGIGPASREF